jgi:hypothetical protein
LIDQSPGHGAQASGRSFAPVELPWFHRWRLALATGGVALISLVVLGVQQAQIRELNATIEKLRESIQTSAPAETPAVKPAPTETGAAEIERLRATVARLTAEVAAAEAVAAENEQLKARGAAGPAITPEELQMLTEARDKARAIMCINHLKQLGLAVRVWANDNADNFPPDTQSMSNEIGSLKVLVCPSDEGRQPAASWPELTGANVSYEYLAGSGTVTEPDRVMFRCPIHGNVTLGDGSVQQGLAKAHPERFVTIDGKLFLKGYGVVAPPAKANPTPSEP